MFTLVVVGLLGGLVTSLSPCILPVLPIVLAAGDDRLRPMEKRSRLPIEPGSGGRCSWSRDSS